MSLEAGHGVRTESWQKLPKFESGVSHGHRNGSGVSIGAMSQTAK